MKTKKVPRLVTLTTLLNMIETSKTRYESNCRKNEQSCIFSAIKFTKKHARAHVGIKKLYSLEKIA